jgi:hypothetical protein
MFFRKDKSLQEIQNWINTQLSVVHPVAKEGLDVIIKPHKSWRSNEQNRFLMVIMQKIVIFYHETGFMPSGCQKWMMTPKIQKEYWKDRFGIEHTRTLDKKQFGDFIDGIQRELVEETNGEWEIIETDSAYLLSLVGEL